MDEKVQDVQMLIAQQITSSLFIGTAPNLLEILV